MRRTGLWPWPIPAAAIAAEAQNHPAPAGKPGLAWRAAARARAMRALLLQEARRSGLRAEPQDLAQGRRETEEEALIRALIEDRAAAERPDVAACRAAYDASPERHRSPTLLEASHILFAAPPDDPPARVGAMAAARATLDALRLDPAAFERLAAERSACASREAGGRLAQFGPGDIAPEIEAALVDLAEGEIAAAPVATRFGIHVLRLDARALGALLPFEAVREKIAESLEKAAWARAARAARALVAGLAARARISGAAL